MRRRSLLALPILLVAGVIAVGCARRLVGAPIAEENIPKIAIGKTTRDEVFKIFGTPYRIEAKGDQEILTYLHGTDFTWTVGLYTEVQQKADILTVYVDKNGVVSNYAFSKGVSTPEIYRRPVPPGY